MTTPLTGNMLIAQSGGPSMVINQSLIGAVVEAKKQKCIRKIFGALHGIKGIMAEDFIDLRRESPATLEAVAATPSSALGSVRKKPDASDCTRIFEVLKKHDVRYFFYIGGNDSAETASIINDEGDRAGYDVRCFHIAKTIDNDLRENDHTPGFGSAARFVAMALMGDDLDNRALPGVKIDVVMGRHAGFLTAASALARQRPDDGPHLIYLPERPFEVQKFLADVKAVRARLGRCVVAVSEGIADAGGKPILESKEMDSHNNIQLSGSGALGDLLAGKIKDEAEAEAKAKARAEGKDETKAKSSLRVRADTLGYLQRSFPCIVSPTDAREARQVGVQAVRTAMKVDNGSIAIKRKPGRKYQVTFECVPLRSVAKETRHMPDEFIAPSGNDVTPAFIDYVRPIVGPLPVMGRFKGVRVPKLG